MADIIKLNIGDVLYDEQDNQYLVQRIYENYATELAVGNQTRKFYVGAIKGLLTEQEHEQKVIERKREIVAEQERIKHFLEEHGIKYLIHFTHEMNIESIKQYGILSREELDIKKIPYVANDENRYDELNNGISLSITRPNWYLLSTFMKNELQPVFIKIDASILWKEITIPRTYYISNAANSDVKKQSGNTFKYLESMFKKEIVYEVASLCQKRTIQRDVHARNNITTDEQAEIIFCGRIDPKYIIAYEIDIDKLKE